MSPQTGFDESVPSIIVLLFNVRVRRQEHPHNLLVSLLTACHEWCQAIFGWNIDVGVLFLLRNKFYCCAI